MITYKEAAELLDYNPNTGELRWKVRRGSRIKAGDSAGCIKPDGYIQIRTCGKAYYAHRLAWLLHYGRWPDDDLDHVNHDRADNRIGNLRKAGGCDNARNQSLFLTNTSGTSGVHWHKQHKKWCAQIGVDKRLRFLGYFTTQEEAAAARQAANKQYGFHENHGKAL